MTKKKKESAASGGAKKAFLQFSWLVVFIAILALALVLFAGAGVAGLVNRSARTQAQAAAVGGDGYAQRARARAETVLVVGSSNDSTVGFSIVRTDADRAAVYEIALPPDMVLPRLQGQVARLDDLYEEDPALAVMVLSDYLRIPIGHWVVTPPATYKVALTDENPALHFATLTRSSFLKEEFLAYRTSIEKIPLEAMRVLSFPTRPVECNGTLYVEPHREEAAEVISDAWGLSVDELSAAPRVAVFNGTETKGRANEVAEALVLRGFQVGEIGNAPNFSYDSTEIQVRDGFEGQARDLCEALGLGEVKTKPVSAKATYDIAVFIGKDYRPDTAGN